MLITLSPAKKLDFKREYSNVPPSYPQFMVQAEQLITQCRTRSVAQLQQLMKISESIACLNEDRYQQWQSSLHQLALQLKHQSNCEHQISALIRPALFAFMGDVYVGLDGYSFSKNQLDWAQQHMIILSGLYGVLRPLDLIQAYRLEMGCALKTEQGDNLYQFWGDKIALALNKQLQQINSELLVNLASEEYFKAIKLPQLQATIVSPVFKDKSKNSHDYKVISFYAKKARGMMARYLIENKITTTDELLNFNVAGYYYDQAQSTINKPVFLRN